MRCSCVKQTFVPRCDLLFSSNRRLFLLYWNNLSNIWCVFCMHFVCILFAFYMHFVCILYAFWMHFICVLYALLKNACIFGKKTCTFIKNACIFKKCIWTHMKCIQNEFLWIFKWFVYASSRPTHDFGFFLYWHSCTEFVFLDRGCRLLQVNNWNWGLHIQKDLVTCAHIWISLYLNHM